MENLRVIEESSPAVTDGYARCNVQVENLRVIEESLKPLTILSDYSADAAKV